MIRAWATGLIAVAAITYPILVYFGLQHLDISILGWLLAALFALRLLISLKQKWRSQALLIALLGCSLAAAAAIQQSEQILKFYPVLVNAAMLLVFGYSLLNPPSVIERFARLRHRELPPEGIQYTRTVTWLWVIFFLVNGGIALWTAVAATMQLWTLYNGAISYLLMGALFLGEWLFRTFVLKVRLHD